jgi:hypothetical protein
MVMDGDVSLSEIVLNNEDDGGEDLLLERDQFFKITKELDCLNQKRMVIEEAQWKRDICDS